MKEENKQAIYYRKVLQQIFDQRLNRNPRYSLRAFARDLGISAERLSAIMRAKYGMSTAQAKKIAKKLRLRKIDSQLFIKSVEMWHARSKAVRDRARLDFEKVWQGEANVGQEIFKLIADWHYFAILVLAHSPDFRSDSNWIAKYLGLEISVVDEMIARLKHLKLLRIDEEGNFLPPQGRLSTVIGVLEDEEQIAAHRSQMVQLLSKAVEKCKRLRPKEKGDRNNFLNSIFLFRPERSEEAFRDLKAFKYEFTKKYGEDKMADEVYAITIGLFSLKEKS